MRGLQHPPEVRHHASSRATSHYSHCNRNAAPLTPSILRPLAMEILHPLEAKQAAERQAERERQ